MFLYENLFFSISSVISIPVMLIGINGAYFPAICRVGFNIKFSRSVLSINVLTLLMAAVNLSTAIISALSFFKIPKNSNRIEVLYLKDLFTHFHDF